MNTIEEFTIIGRVGEIREVGTALPVSVASSFSRRDNRGEWVERTRWNAVTVFGEATRGYVKRNIGKGGLVFTSGSLAQSKWEKDGETFYGVTLACERIERLCKGPNRADPLENGQEQQDGRRWTTTFRFNNRWEWGGLRPLHAFRQTPQDPPQHRLNAGEADAEPCYKGRHEPRRS